MLKVREVSEEEVDSWAKMKPLASREFLREALEEDQYMDVVALSPEHAKIIDEELKKSWPKKYIKKGS